MKITLDKAIELLNQAAAIILPDEEGTPLMYPSVSADEDDFLSMSWTDEEGLEFTIDCLREKNEEVEVINNSLLEFNDGGTTVRVQLLMPISIEVSGTTTIINLMQ